MPGSFSTVLLIKRGVIKKGIIKRGIIKKGIIFVVFLLVFSIINSVLANSTQELSKEKKLQQLTQDIGSLKDNIKKQHGEKSLLEKELRNAEQLIANNARQIFIIQKDIVQLDKQLAKLNATLNQHDQKLVEQQQLLSGQLQASYIIGRQEALKLLLNQQDPAIISRILAYYDYFNAARSQQIEAVNLLLKKIMDNKQAISMTRQSLNDKYQALNREKQHLQEKQAQRNKLIAQLNLDIVSQDKKLSTLVENKKNLARIVDQIKQTLDDTSNIPVEKSFRRQKGHLYWPAKGKIKSLFGHWRGTGKVKWQGNMIKAEEGSPVHAVYYGRVAYADWLRGYGLIIIIDHGDGYMSLYGHNQTLLKEVGDWVESDEIIATVGGSGGLTQVGLYFEIRYNGKPSNPDQWCKKG